MALEDTRGADLGYVGDYLGAFVLCMKPVPSRRAKRKGPEKEEGGDGRRSSKKESDKAEAGRRKQ